MTLSPLILALCFLPLGADPAAVPETRTPAEVMSFHGARWLERPERDAEERPDDVVAAMEIRPGNVIADIGCGTGYFSRRFAKATGDTGKVYAVDIQPEFIDMLKERCAKEKIANIVPVLGTETDPLLPEGGVDWIFLADVYHEFQKPKEMLAAMLKALKPDGKVCLVEYRLLGETAKHIKAEHRMSVKQVLSEWQPAGFELVDLQDFLPAQHLFIFHKRK